MSTEELEDREFAVDIESIIKLDLIGLIQARRNYGNSWRRRGGVGAFMMLARKWDRIENLLKGKTFNYDIFEAMKIDHRDEGIIDDIRDLRRYLILVESVFIEQEAKVTDGETAQG